MTIVNIEQASIRTATVTIKTLTVNGRQVTQALFRQLIAEPIIDPYDGTLRGTPWGIVNYHPKCRQDGWSPEHLHVVWQRGSELRRATVRPSHVDRTWGVDAEAEERRHAAHQESWRLLTTLDQLFIAV